MQITGSEVLRQAWKLLSYPKLVTPRYSRTFQIPHQLVSSTLHSFPILCTNNLPEFIRNSSEMEDRGGQKCVCVYVSLSLSLSLCMHTRTPLLAESSDTVIHEIHHWSHLCSMTSRWWFPHPALLLPLLVFLLLVFRLYPRLPHGPHVPWSSILLKLDKPNRDHLKWKLRWVFVSLMNLQRDSTESPFTYVINTIYYTSEMEDRGGQKSYQKYGPREGREGFLLTLSTSHNMILCPRTWSVLHSLEVCQSIVTPQFQNVVSTTSTVTPIYGLFSR